MLERRDGTISVNYPRILRYYSPEPEPGSRCNNTRPEPSSTWADISGAWAACGEEMARDVSWWTAENWVVTICMNQRGGGFLARPRSLIITEMWFGFRQLFDCCPVSGDPEAEARPMVTGRGWRDSDPGVSRESWPGRWPQMSTCVITTISNKVIKLME